MAGKKNKTKQKLGRIKSKITLYKGTAQKLKSIEKNAIIKSFGTKYHYYTTLLLTAFIIITLSIILFPILLLLDLINLYLVIIIIAVSFGLIFDHFIYHIEGIRKKHKIFGGVIIFIFALINMIVMTSAANKVINDIGLKTSLHNPLIVSLVYAAAFLLPYTYSRLSEKI